MTSPTGLVSSSRTVGCLATKRVGAHFDWLVGAWPTSVPAGSAPAAGRRRDEDIWNVRGALATDETGPYIYRRISASASPGTALEESRSCAVGTGAGVVAAPIGGLLAEEFIDRDLQWER